jgi:hypothetical protein
MSKPPKLTVTDVIQIAMRDNGDPAAAVLQYMQRTDSGATFRDAILAVWTYLQQSNTPPHGSVACSKCYHVVEEIEARFGHFHPLALLEPYCVDCASDPNFLDESDNVFLFGRPRHRP